MSCMAMNVSYLYMFMSHVHPEARTSRNIYAFLFFESSWSCFGVMNLPSKYCGILLLLLLLLLLQVSQFAARKRVVLKGDLPIGVDKRSVDTWMEVRYMIATVRHCRGT